MKSYSSLKEVLIDKLEALTGQDGETLFAGVHGVNKTDPDGYPSAFVLERTGGGQLLDTHRNEREWQFTIVIHQAIGNKSAEDAYAALLDAVDRVITSFDQDPMLLDSNDVARCKWVKVVPLEFEYASQEVAVHRALLVIGINDIVNRYAP